MLQRTVIVQPSLHSDFLGVSPTQIDLLWPCPFWIQALGVSMWIASITEVSKLQYINLTQGVRENLRAMPGVKCKKYKPEEPITHHI